MLFDTHAHLDDAALYSDVVNILQRAREAGIDWINSVGCDWRSSLLNVHLAEKHPDMVYASVGVHPSELRQIEENVWEKLTELAKTPRVIGWGEIGLDYHYDDTDKDLQQKYFRAQISLAKEVGKPIIIHDRDSHQDVVDILRQEHAGINGGILHCFSGSWEMAKQCLAMGFMISFAGPLTYKNARVPVEVAAKVPLDMLLVETDSPYLTPHPFRGKTNEPARVVYTAEKLAQIRHLDYEEIAAITTANAKRIFQL